MTLRVKGDIQRRSFVDKNDDGTRRQVRTFNNGEEVWEDLPEHVMDGTLQTALIDNDGNIIYETDPSVPGDPDLQPSRGEEGPQGPQGPMGAKGDTGDTGPQGPKGDTGDTPTVTVGSTITLPPGSNAVVIEDTTPTGVQLSFEIPRGDQGTPGSGGGGVTTITNAQEYEATTWTQQSVMQPSVDFAVPITDSATNPVAEFRWTGTNLGNKHCGYANAMTLGNTVAAFFQIVQQGVPTPITQFVPSSGGFVQNTLFQNGNEVLIWGTNLVGPNPTVTDPEILMTHIVNGINSISTDPQGSEVFSTTQTTRARIRRLCEATYIQPSGGNAGMVRITGTRPGVSNISEVNNGAFIPFNAQYLGVTQGTAIQFFTFRFTNLYYRFPGNNGWSFITRDGTTPGGL